MQSMQLWCPPPNNRKEILKRSTLGSLLFLDARKFTNLKHAETEFHKYTDKVEVNTQ